MNLNKYKLPRRDHDFNVIMKWEIYLFYISEIGLYLNFSQTLLQFRKTVECNKNVLRSTIMQICVKSKVHVLTYFPLRCCENTGRRKNTKQRYMGLEGKQCFDIALKPFMPNKYSVTVSKLKEYIR